MHLCAMSRHKFVQCHTLQSLDNQVVHICLTLFLESTLLSILGSRCPVCGLTQLQPVTSTPDCCPNRRLLLVHFQDVFALILASMAYCVNSENAICGVCFCFL